MGESSGVVKEQLQPRVREQAQVGVIDGDKVRLGNADAWRMGKVSVFCKGFIEAVADDEDEGRTLIDDRFKRVFALDFDTLSTLELTRDTLRPVDEVEFLLYPTAAPADCGATAATAPLTSTLIAKLKLQYFFWVAIESNFVF